MKITHINPDSMLKNPAFSQAVMVEDAKKILYIGEQNGVDASELWSEMISNRRPSRH